MKDYIIEQMKKGKTLDEIAAELAKAMNEAEKEFTDKATEEKILNDSLNEAANAINCCLEILYPEEKVEPITAKDVKGYIDIYIAEAKIAERLATSIKFNIDNPKKNPFSDFFKIRGIM